MFKAKHNIAREIMKELLKAVLIESVQSKASGPHIRPSTLGLHKIFNQLNFLLFKVKSLWSCAHYFQWFTDYVNNVDLLMSHVHVLNKLPHCLIRT